MNPRQTPYNFLLVLLLPTSAVCGDASVDMPAASYFEDKQRGWFWYEVLPEPAKKNQPDIQADQEKPKPEIKPPIAVEAEIEPQTRPQTAVDPQPLSSAWLKQNLEHYLNQAIDDPSPENVAAFYYLVDPEKRFLAIV